MPLKLRPYGAIQICLLLLLLLNRFTDRLINSIFGKVGRSASEHVIVELLKTKYLPVLLYDLEVCSPTKAQTRSMDVISSCYRKIFLCQI